MPSVVSNFASVRSVKVSHMTDSVNPAEDAACVSFLLNAGEEGYVGRTFAT